MWKECPHHPNLPELGGDLVLGLIVVALLGLEGSLVLGIIGAVLLGCTWSPRRIVPMILFVDRFPCVMSWQMVFGDFCWSLW